MVTQLFLPQLMNRMRNSAILLCGAAALALSMPASAQQFTDESDPFENYNRAIFEFNEVIDQSLLEPVARGYRFAVPHWGRERIHNSLKTLDMPVTFVNSLLQGNVAGSFDAFWRFFINVTFGIGGMFDVATEAAIPNQKRDFEQSLALAGVDQGPYLVWPVFGPSSVRGTVGMAGDAAVSPLNYADERLVPITESVVDAIDSRERLLDPIDQIRESSFDRYATVRSAYLQRRERFIKTGSE